MSKTEAVIKKMINLSNHDMKISFPAKVIGVENLKDGLIDVQPIVNYLNPLTQDSHEYPILSDVRVIYPSTKTTTICFPINQGDFVDLVFQSASIDKFVNGNVEMHDPVMSSFGNMSDVVAYVGFEPYQQSCMNPNNYRNDFDNQDLNIVHNKNTDNEVILKLTSEGELKIKSPQKVFVESPEVHVEADNVTVDAQTVDAKNSVIKTYNDVEIKGKSVYQFMTTHIHSGVQSGNSNTAPPNQT